MELKSMKLSAEAVKASAPPTAITSGQAPEYPYGLCLSLDGESLKTLGLSVDGLKVGQAVTLHAMGTVKGLSKSERDDGKPHENAELQITDLAVEPGKAEAKTDGGVPASRSSEAVLYGGGGNVTFEQ